MAISKTQPMRPAEIALVDAVNELETLTASHTQSIGTLTEGLADEIADREQADTALTTRIAAEELTRASNDSALSARINTITDVTIPAIGDRIDTIVDDTIPALDDRVETVEGDIPILDGRVTALEGKAGDFHLGLTQTITVPANDSVSTTETFTVPFLDTELCGVYPFVVTSDTLTLFELTVTGCTYSGFSFSVSNSDTNPHDIRVGYLAVSFGTSS